MYSFFLLRYIRPAMRKSHHLRFLFPFLFLSFFLFIFLNFPCSLYICTMPMSWPPAWRTLLVFLGAMTFCFSFYSFGYSPPISPALGLGRFLGYRRRLFLFPRCVWECILERQ
ncbi:hypothetical protein BDV23DRAFT_39545 [Aspergillus alliaceus]|uniref:Uncharacterized protein n=1 Tax=Petromyces alliaceus TaxID=209559 RepID=A0A5N7CGZ1_PETAA|nr:hypothetical protein BDV23DRAFT_39545 [Aspergillus alliaceus]